MIDDLVSLKDAANILGVSKFKLSRLIRDGLLPTYGSPLDRREKLVRRQDLDILRQPVLLDPGTTDTGKAALLAA